MKNIITNIKNKNLYKHIKTKKQILQTIKKIQKEKTIFWKNDENTYLENYLISSAKFYLRRETHYVNYNS